MMKTFSQWFDLREAVIAKSVMGLGPAQGGGFVFVNDAGQQGTSSAIKAMKNLNYPDEQGNTRWEIKTQNSTYIVTMDNATAQKVAQAWQQSKQVPQRIQQPIQQPGQIRQVG